MKIADFVLLEKDERSILDYKYKAKISVTERNFWLKKVTKTREIMRTSNPHCRSWYFTDTGEVVSQQSEVIALARAWSAANPTNMLIF